jgi:hypothetical protein
VKSGTFNFWIDRDTAPDTFAAGSRCRWAVFPIEGEKCTICSDGPTLTATLRMGEQNQHRLFRIPFSPSLQRRHHVTIGWSKGCLKVILDSKVIAEIPATFLVWLVLVTMVLASHV